jgi:hypothetical protein
MRRRASLVGVEETGRASLLAGAGGVGGWPEGRIVYSRGPQGISAARESKRSENGLKCPFISKTRNTHKPKISSHHFYFTYFYSIRDFFFVFPRKRTLQIQINRCKGTKFFGFRYITLS